MKNIKPFLILLLLSSGVYAQKPCTQLWKNEFPVDPKYRMVNEDHTLLLEGNMNEIAMIDAVGGKVLWMMNFKKVLDAKSVKKWNWMEEKGVVKVTVKGDKKDEEKDFYYDEKTGTAVGDITSKVLKTPAKSRTRLNSYIELKEKGLALTLKYEKRSIGELIKNKPLEMTIECIGNKIWSKTIVAKVTTSLVEKRSEGGEPIIDFNVQGDKVFLVYEGISVLDLNTGNLLWETTFDNADYDFGIFKSRQTLGRAGTPLASNDGVYVVDLSKKQNCIKKFESETGKLIWKTDAFDKDAIVPELTVINNVLIARFGGRVTVETYIPGQSGSPEVYKSEPKMIGDFGLKAYDVASGKLLWETGKMKELGDKFSNAITNMLNIENLLFVASDKNLFSFTSAGKTNYITPLNKLGLGTPTKIFRFENSIIVIFEEGIASFDMNKGTKNYVTATKKALSTFFAGDVFYVWTGSDIFKLEDFIRFDLGGGQIISKMKDTPYPYFSEDGETFLKIDSGKYYRYKTK